MTEAKEKRRQVEQQLKIRVTEWRQKADSEGVELDAELISFSTGSVECFKLEVINEKLSLLESTWQEHVDKAEQRRAEIRQKCLLLCSILREQYCEPTATNNHLLLQRLSTLHEDLVVKRNCRLADLTACKETFQELNISVEIDLDDLSVVNVTKWTLLSQQAVKEQRERIVNIHKGLVSEVVEHLDVLSEPIPTQYTNIDYTAADIHDLLKQIKELKADLPKLASRSMRAKKVKQILSERNALIVQMQVFERTASDPARLFAPSFRLLQEERFRKSALPTLKRLEARLVKELEEFDASEQEPYKVNGEPLREVLERERGERFVNETVFGFNPSSSSSATIARDKREQSPAKRQRENVNNK